MLDKKSYAASRGGHSLTFGPSSLYFPSSAFLGRNFPSRTSSAKLASPESAHVLTLMAPVFVI